MLDYLMNHPVLAACLLLALCVCFFAASFRDQQSDRFGASGMGEDNAAWNETKAAIDRVQAEEPKSRDDLIEELNAVVLQLEAIERETPRTYLVNPEWQRLNDEALHIAGLIEGRIARTM